MKKINNYLYIFVTCIIQVCSNDNVHLCKCIYFTLYIMFNAKRETYDSVTYTNMGWNITCVTPDYAFQDYYSRAISIKPGFQFWHLSWEFYYDTFILQCKRWVYAACITDHTFHPSVKSAAAIFLGDIF